MNRKLTDCASCSSSTFSSDLSQANSNPPILSHSASSSANPQGYEYEVFLSFRGSDTRKGFTDYLYTSLRDAGIRVFRDNEELRVGEDIGGNLLEAINQSKIFIPIFSKGYASSKWCLKEAAHMSKCRNSRNHLVLPIFYDVTPDQVKHQSGTYEEAFKQHSELYDEKTVQEWRNALVEVGALKGWESQKVADGHEGELVKIVVSEVWRELKKAHLIIEDSIIKLEDSIEDVLGMLRIGSSDVRVVGLYGIGGIGKTTLAKIIYNQLLEHFEYSSFLKDVREMSSQPKGLEKLQTQLVTDILRSKDLQPVFYTIDEGIKVLREKFRDKKVLLLLDDVDNDRQINALAADGNWFGGGSRIIITTRKKGVLDGSGVKETYEVRPMHDDEALHLFKMHAFKWELHAADYMDLPERIVATTGGLPLALEIIGSYLSTKKSKEIWEGTLEKLQKSPPKDVQDKLRISYDTLELVQQQIFLDIACFFIGTDKRIATYMWKDSGFYPEVEVDVLLQRCLIKIGDDNKFWMHDQLRDLGREIVQNENVNEPGKRSRLWSSGDVRRVLENQEATEKIKAIQFHYGMKLKEYGFTRERPMNLPNVKFLRLVGNERHGKPSWRHRHYGIDISLSMVNLVILDLSKSNVTGYWSGWSSKQLGVKLKVLILEFCINLFKVPDLSKFQKLERLSFEGCGYLYEVGPSIGKLKNLIFLNLRNCRQLKELPKELNDLQALVELYIDYCGGTLPNLGGLKKLELLSANRCNQLNDISSFIGRSASLLEISLDYSRVCALPDSIKTLVKLKCLSLRGCQLAKLPDSIGQLTSLEKLFLSRSTIQALPDSMGNLINLQVLLVDRTYIMNLPSTLGMLEKLEVIDASGCSRLQGAMSIDLVRLCSLKTLKLEQINNMMLPTDINESPCFQCGHCDYCSTLQTLPQLPTSLQCLSVSCKQIKTFPDLSINTNLLELELVGCTTLERIPGLGNLVFLKILTMSDCSSLTELHGLEGLECLRELSISWCNSFKKLDLPKSKQLKKLEVLSCMSLQSISNLSAFKMLRHLSFAMCWQLCTVEGLGELESLRNLDMDCCKAIENLPNLSKLVNLQELIFKECVKLRIVEGLGELKSLECLNMKGCITIENLPNLSKLVKLKELILADCKKLKELHGLEKLISLKRIDIGYSPSLYYYTKEWPHIPWKPLPRELSMLEPFRDYKVFLSFRGQDLSDRLVINLDVTTFRDDGELGRDRIEAMNRSKISIPIFSRGYAFSTRCLQELAHIMECKEKSNQSVLPIFYDVSPEQVQEQSGIYEEAFKQHMNCYDAEIVEMWRAALREVGALNGWELQHVVDEKDTLMRDVLSDIQIKAASNYKVGIEVHVEEVMKLLDINANDVRIVGIHGRAGIGKTTLAKVIYNQLKEHFVYHYFLTNIREASPQYRGLKELQDIVRPNNPTEFEFASLDEGINVPRRVDGKVLIVVDDFDRGDQPDALVPYIGLFARGSRIILTTRKKEALDIYQVQRTYELNELQFSDALVLFIKHASTIGEPSPKFITLSREIVSLIRRFPLAVEVIGSLLKEANEEFWESMPKKLKEAPGNDMQSMLRIVYDSLDDKKQEAFLDIACFFIGTNRWTAGYMRKWDNKVLEGCFNKLYRLSLVKVLDNDELWMHDQLRDLGREIAQWQRYNVSDKRIRLWHSEEAIEVLNKKQNTERIKAICLNYGTQSEGCCFGSDQFTLLPNLEFLRLYKSNIAGNFDSLLNNLKVLLWHHCPNELLATNLYLPRLLVLELSETDITDDWNGWSFAQMSNLEVLVLKSCRRITKTPNFLKFPRLSTLILDDCTSLIIVDPSIRGIRFLRCLSLKSCKSLRELPTFIGGFSSLVELDLSDMSIDSLPESIGELRRLEVLNMSASKLLRELPSSIGRCRSLRKLDFSYTSIDALPGYIGKLEDLEVLNMSACKLLRKLPSFNGRCWSLKKLDLSHTSIDALPDSIGRLWNLEVLNMSASSITYLPRSLGKLMRLQVIDVSYCRNLHGEIVLEPMRLRSLREFIMVGTNITLPPSISGLLRLRGLNWAGCYVPRAFNDSDDVML